MIFRDFAVEHKNGEIIITQNREDDFIETITLDEKQLPLFIEALTGNKYTETYTASLECNVDDITCYAEISSDSIQGLFNEKKSFFDSFVYDLDCNPYRGDDTIISDIRKVLQINMGDK